MKKSKDKISIRYEFQMDPDLSPHYVNGLDSFITPREDLHVSFFTNVTAIPQACFEHDYEEGYHETELIERTHNGCQIGEDRYVRAKLIIDYEAACAIKESLEELLSDTEELFPDDGTPKQ